MDLFDPSLCKYLYIGSVVSFLWFLAFQEVHEHKLSLCEPASFFKVLMVAKVLVSNFSCRFVKTKLLVFCNCRGRVRVSLCKIHSFLTL